MEWDEALPRQMVADERAISRLCEITRKISSDEMMKFKIGLDGLNYRPRGPGDSAVGVLAENEAPRCSRQPGSSESRPEAAHEGGARTGLVVFAQEPAPARDREVRGAMGCRGVFVPVPLPQSRARSAAPPGRA